MTAGETDRGPISRLSALSSELAIRNSRLAARARAAISDFQLSSSDFQLAKRSRFARGFTLIEMLAVLAIIGIMIGAIGYVFRTGGSSTVGLQAAQSQVAALLTLARGQAAVNGRDAALFVSAKGDDPDRYLRFLVVVVRDASDATKWNPVSAGVYLPQGVYVVPTAGAGALKEDSSVNWQRGSDTTELRSTALDDSTFALVAVAPSTTAEPWLGVQYTSRGTTTDSGDIVLVSGRANAPGSAQPLVLSNPDNVRGIAISSYGQVTLIDNRAGF